MGSILWARAVLELADNKALQHWHDLHEHLLDWAFRAYDRLIGELSEDLQKKLRLKDGAEESYVVIFGKTQVGKTTLLLDLMGVKQDPGFMDTVSLVLRGGREAGKSATATAMEYCRSADERWGIALTSEPEWFDDDASATQRLGKMRDDMEAGRLTTDKPCVVHIPLQFFEKDRATGPQVRILDLPGDNPANQQEQKHVSQMASTYLPFADLILLVGRGDDLRFLSSDDIKLPGIEDWQAMPHRFRIVTTYSYTAQSVKDMIRHDESINDTKLRKRLIEQIERFGTFSEAARAPDLYFPLEFGTSWKVMREQEQSLHERIEPIIRNLREDLLVQIRQCSSPIGRLRSTWNTHISIKHLGEKKKATNADQQDGLRKKINDQDADIDIWQKKIERIKGQKSKREQLNSTAQCVSITDLKFERIMEGQFLPSDNNKDAASLRQMVISLKHRLQEIRLSVNTTDEQQRKHSSWVNRYLQEPNQYLIQEILRNSFKSINDKLNGFWFDRYFNIENYNADKNEIIKAGINAEHELKELLKANWDKAKKKADDDLQTELKNTDIELTDAGDELTRTLKDKEAIERERQKLVDEMEKFDSEFKEDLKRCDEFEYKLNDEYLKALDARMTNVIETEDDCDALLLLLSCWAMRDQRAQLMAMKDTEQEYHHESDNRKN